MLLDLCDLENQTTFHLFSYLSFFRVVLTKFFGHFSPTQVVSFSNFHNKPCVGQWYFKFAHEVVITNGVIIINFEFNGAVARLVSQVYAFVPFGVESVHLGLKYD